MSSVPAIGEFICCPWTPREIIGMRPYTGVYTQWFDLILKVRADTKKGWVETTFNSSDWEFEQSKVRQWRKENDRQK